MNIKYSTHEHILQNTGWQKPKIKRFGKKKHWKRGDGNMGAAVLRPDGQWINDVQQLPLEVQNQYVETFDCWSWNTNVIYEIMMFVKWGIKFVSSKRFNNVMGGGTPNGGQIQDGCETVRKDGMIDESLLPWQPVQDTWPEFHSPDPMTANLIAEGKKWLRKYLPAHDWVVYPGLFGKVKVLGGGDMYEVMWSLLPQSPLGVAVYAWPAANSNGLTSNPTGTYNHWTKIVGGEYKQYWTVYDSYSNCWRKLVWNYPFRWVKRYDINESTVPQQDADYIKKNYFGQNVKGDSSSAIYYIFNGYKQPYPDMDEFNSICDKWRGGNRTFITVAQDALDLIPEGLPITYDSVSSAPIYFSPSKP